MATDQPASEPDHEPDRSAEAGPSAPASPDTHTSEGDAGSGDRIGALERTVAGLVDVVAALAPKDHAPVKVPWTHRGSARRDDE